MQPQPALRGVWIREEASPRSKRAPALAFLLTTSGLRRWHPCSCAPGLHALDFQVQTCRAGIRAAAAAR